MQERKQFNSILNRLQGIDNRKEKRYLKKTGGCARVLYHSVNTCVFLNFLRHFCPWIFISLALNFRALLKKNRFIVPKIELRNKFSNAWW